MPGENTSGTAEKAQTALPKESPKRERSSIAFPYLDLNEAAGVAVAIHKNVGPGTCSVEQLAPWMQQSPTSSAFRARLNTARLFGLVDTERSDALQLTDLGRVLVDPKREREARAKAFLEVPLYRALYEKCKGGVLPPAAALEKELVSLGVASTQKDRARQTLERSAEQAGFFESGRERLVLPGFAPTGETSGTQHGESRKPGGSGGGGGGDGGTPPRHPLVEGLFLSLPVGGEKWSLEEAVDWLQAAASNFRIAYKIRGTITVTGAPPKALPAPDEN